MSDLVIISVLSAVTALGVGISAFFFAMGILYSTSSVKLAERLRSFRPEKKKSNNKKTEGLLHFDIRMALASLAGVLAFGCLAWDTPYLPISILMGNLVAIAMVMGVRYFKKSSDRFLLLREAAVLYESIDLFGQAGFTVRQAMQMSLPLVTKLRPALEKCIESWGSGPSRAIEKLGHDIGIQEADVLISILMHAEEVGTAKLSGLMEEEATRIDELRQALAEMRVAGKPVYATAYTFLPVATLLGIIMGPLAYRAIKMIENLRAPGGM